MSSNPTSAESRTQVDGPVGRQPAAAGVVQSGLAQHAVLAIDLGAAVGADACSSAGITP